jgi:hypothetical protein
MFVSEALAVTSSTVTADRVVAGAAALVGLAGAVLGGRALLNHAGRNRRRTSAMAVAAGVLSAVVGVLIIVTADGGPGTGNGIVGGYVAVALGLVGLVLGGLALTRSRSTA